MSANILKLGDKAPAIDATAFVASGCQIVGDVEIAADASVWYNCVVRADVNRIRIGARTNIQDGTIVHVMKDTHPTIIGNDVTVGHAAVVHGCTIEDRCLIGMGAILLNGVVVGSGSIVAAGTLLPEGTVVPPRSLVMGAPGKVRRTLGDEDLAEIQMYADRYVAYRLDYM